MIRFSLTIALLIASTSLFCSAATPDLPIRGLHCSAPGSNDLTLCVQFIREALPKEGVNVLVLEFNYGYQYTSHPELVAGRALSKEEVKELVAACKDAGVQLIPQFNCLGHQSWSKSTFPLLTQYPEFDETPGKYPANEGIYCRSYCPLHPDVHKIIFALIDELADVCETKAFHVGMDEVFLLGEDDCERCKGKNKAELFAGEITKLRNHLAEKDRTLWMWGDRFIDGKITEIGKWEASTNDTAPAIDLVPKDIMICDWHYEWAPPTASYFALKGFNVVSSPWRKPDVALALLDQIRMVRKYSKPAISDRLQGVLHTTWCGMAPFVRAYNGEESGRKSNSAIESADCFKKLFAAIRDN
ncbi:MAG: glycoside hydrolase [Candidatus Omnitrophota bacterium]|jgi:hypothetical protein|nr:MAG: glycoside hydrolase [Candidatus Omnitrophota bacterium]